MGVPRFGRPKGGDTEISSNLFVANCGPGVGISYDDIKEYFSNFGEVKGVYAADESGARVVVCFDDKNCANSALEALHGNLCHELGGRRLHISYSVLQPSSQEVSNERNHYFIPLFFFFCHIVCTLQATSLPQHNQVLQ